MHTCMLTCAGMSRNQQYGKLKVVLLLCALGWGPLFPLKAMARFNMTYAEAIGMFLTGEAIIPTVC